MRDVNGSQISLVSEVADDLVIGVGSRVWSYTVIERGVRIGNGVVIGAHCFIGAGTKIGDFTRIQDGVFIPRNCEIDDHVFVGPHVVLTDDKYPVAGNTIYTAQPPRLKSYASIGANATIMPGVTIGIGGSVGAGSVVTHDVEASDLVMGVPARSKEVRDAKVSQAYEGRAQGQGREEVLTGAR